MFRGTRASTMAAVLLIALTGCAGHITTPETAVSTTAVRSSPTETFSPALLENSNFTTTSGSSPDVDLGWLTSKPFRGSFSSLDGHPTIGFDGPCNGASWNYSVDEAGNGTILEPHGMTFVACLGATGEHGYWFHTFMNRPGTSFTVTADTLVITSGGETISALIA